MLKVIRKNNDPNLKALTKQFIENHYKRMAKKKKKNEGNPISKIFTAICQRK